MNAILVIDIGNTSVSIGIYQRGKITRAKRLKTTTHGVASITRILKAVISASALKGVSACSVVPSANARWIQALRRVTKAPVFWVNHKLDIGIPITYPKPATLGTDRLANICGGTHKYGAPLIVADFGTAATFNVVTKRHGFVGGVIAPGLPLMFSYLAEKTAKLPLIKPGPTRNRVGKTTREAMKLGARWGYCGMVQEILTQLMKHPELRRAKLIATGGYADEVARDLKPRMIVDHSLTMYGLGKIHELNS